MRAAETLEDDDIQCRVLNMHSIKPLDCESIKKASEETGGIIALEEQYFIERFR